MSASPTAISKNRKSVRIGGFSIGRGKGSTVVSFTMHEPETGSPDDLVSRPLSRMVAEARLILKDLGVTL